MMIASPAGHGRASRGAVPAIHTQGDPKVVSATRVCVAFALVSLALLLPARASAQECGEGDRQVRSLHFVGNKTFDDDALSAYVVTTASSFAKRHFRIFGTARCYPVGGLAQDTLNIKNFYKANGFYDTRVDTAVTIVGRGVVDVTFRIDEGRPLLLDSLEIAGLGAVPDSSQITKDLQLEVGERVGRLKMVSDEATILSRLHNSGYPKAQIYPQFDTHPADHRAEVRLEVVPGVRTRFGAIRVASTSQTGGPPKIDSAVVRGLLGFESGNRYSDDALANAQRNLYNLGAFKHVQLDTTSREASVTDGAGAPAVGGTDRTAKDSLADTLTDVTVTLREDYLRQYDQEEGWATLDCFRLNAQYTNKNFLDDARRLELTGRLSKIGYGSPLATPSTRNLCYRPRLDQDSIASSKINYYLGASMRQPTLFGTHWVPAYTAYTERRGEYLAYLRTTYVGGDVSATRSIGEGMPLRFGYTLEYGKTQAQPAVLCAEFFRCTTEEQEEFERTLRLAVASVSLQRIRVDDRVEPTRGYIIAGELRGAAPLIGSDPSQQFGKGTIEISGYRSLSKNFVMAARITGGLITAPADSTGAKLPPYQERLFAGGPNSVRGFGQNLLGPVVYLLGTGQFNVDTVAHTPASTTTTYVLKDANPVTRTQPLGGNALFVFNAEFRIRDPFLPNLLQYVPFVDGGQVWTQVPNVSNFHLLRGVLVTPGLGFRITSPIGPIQISLGYNPYLNQQGPVYFASPVDPVTGAAPLICVTPPGAQTVPVTVSANGSVTQAKCPGTFAPPRAASFFQRLTKTFSIATSF
jgi:outer membrane protein insertion porin family/translocation and assembly module TamA